MMEKFPRRKKITRREALGVIAGGALAAAAGAHLFEKDSGAERLGVSEKWLGAVGKFKEQYSSVKPNYDPERWGDGPNNPESYLDIVLHYGKREVINGDGLSRIAFVRERLGEKSNLPPTLVREIKRASAGLAAQESAFHNGLTSRSGAKGIFQFMPATWKGLGYEPNDIRFLTNQVEAASKLFDQSYAVLLGRSKNALESIKRGYFDDDDEAFDRYFLAPILLNAHNAGAARMSGVVGWFSENILAGNGSAITKKLYPNGVGYDLFHAMSEVSRVESNELLLKDYGVEASEYSTRVYALAELVRERGH